jgi:ribose 1,5-bisphosphokinase
MPTMPAARIVYVMGPSGAGKDSVLRYARERLDGQHPIVFAHRYITRPPTPGDENHIALTASEFAARKARNLFAMHWHAHGFEYGIGIEIEQWREAGCLVVVSGSREHFERQLASAAGIVPVIITSDPETLTARLTARSREDAHTVRERVARAVAAPQAHPALVTIDNSGPLEHAGDSFLKLLRDAASSGR